MTSRIKRCLERYYYENAWMNHEQYQRILSKIDSDDLPKDIESWDEDRMISFVESAVSSTKELFLRINSRLQSKNQYYSVPQKIFEVGKESSITIAGKYNYQRLVGTYKIVISSFHNYEYATFERYVAPAQTVIARDNKLVFQHRFESEDRYIINVFYPVDNQEIRLLTTSVYAVESDLFSLHPYKADLHMHTTYSDGFEPPELVVASARQRGMDVIAVTDHNQFKGSVEARRKASEMNLNLTVVLGEEYSLDYSPMHIVSIGTSKPIERRFLTWDILGESRVKHLMETERELTCDRRSYACTQVLLEEVAKMGGITILAHPYWKIIHPDGTRMDTPENLFRELARDRRFNGIEIVSGSPQGECDCANLQSALALDMLGSYNGISITGITDSHRYSTDPITGAHYTIIFSKSNKDHDVLDALRNDDCVAIELVGNRPMCYGQYRLIKYAHFLVEFYFPERDSVAYLEGANAVKEHLLSTN